MIAGVRNFWFTDAQFIPRAGLWMMPLNCCRKIVDSGMRDIHWAAYIRADNLTPQLCDLMVKNRHELL
jgi:hypothetical protein